MKLNQRLLPVLLAVLCAVGCLTLSSCEGQAGKTPAATTAMAVAM